MILDEPTASLDPRSVGQVVKAIEAAKATRDIAIVVVEHRVKDFVDMVDRLVVLHHGRLKCDCRRGDVAFSEAKERAKTPPVYDRPTRQSETPVVLVRGLSLEIDGWEILDRVDLDIMEGSVVALMGENGSGKTTLLRHLVGLQTVQEGTVSVFGHSMSPERRVDPWRLGRDIGFVFQNPNHQIFENTVEREMLFAPGNFGTDDSYAYEALEDFERREGLKRYVHPHCLSFGQKRRVNILSAYSHEPKLLLLDEPFAGQDQDNVERITSIMGDILGNGGTVVVVTHDSSFARSYCTDAIVLHEGRVIASGPVESLSEAVWSSLNPEDRA